MKKKKLSLIIATSTIAFTTLMASPSLVSFADSTNTANQNQKEVNVQNKQDTTNTSKNTTSQNNTKDSNVNTNSQNNTTKTDNQNTPSKTTTSDKTSTQSNTSSSASNKESSKISTPKVDSSKSKVATNFSVTTLNEIGVLNTAPQDSISILNKPNGTTTFYAPNNALIHIIGSTGDYYKITTNIDDEVVTGYLPKSSIFICSSNAIGAGTISQSNGFDGAYTYVQNGPSWNNTSTIASLNLYSSVAILGEEHGWFKIQFMNNGKLQTGFVLNDRVSTPLNFTKFKTIKTGTIYTPNYTHTAAQSSPSWNGDFMGDIYNGTQVDITGEYNGWYRVNYTNGTSVWIPQDRVMFNNNKKYLGNGVINRYTDIQSGPSWTGTNTLNTLNTNTPVNIISRKDGWYEIQNGNGTAWVLCDRVTTSLNNEKFPVLNTAVVNFPLGYTCVQSGPSWNDDYISTINNGQKVDITGEDNGWYRITIPSNGQTAWILKSRVEIIGKNSIGTGSINTYTDVQSGPSWNDSTVTTLNTNDAVSILGREHGWYQIQSGNTVGWVLCNRISTSLNATQFKSTGLGYIDFQGNTHTSIQSGPSWSDDYIGPVNNGTVVDITGEYDGWYRLNTNSTPSITNLYPNAPVWVPASRVKLLSGTNQGTGLANMYTYVQSGPSWTNTNTIGSLNTLDAVAILGEEHGWFKIAYGNGVGYVLANRIDSSLNHTLPVKSTEYINNGNVGYTYLQSGPSWNDDPLGTLTNGTKVQVVSSYDGWTEINYKGSTAWLPSYRVSPSNPEAGIGNGVIDFTGGNYTYVMSTYSWSGQTVGSITDGTNVTIYAKKAGWYEIGYNGGRAWVLGNRVNTKLNCNQKSIGTAYINNGYTGYTDVQSGPAWNDDTLGTLTNGAKVQVISSYNGWTEINFENSTGWIPSPRLTNSSHIYSNVQYDATMDTYIADETKEYMETVGDSNLSKAQLSALTNEIAKSVNPKYANTDLQFLRVDTFRNVNEQAFANALQGKGVLSGQAPAFIAAAKKYNIDPVYFMAQSALETGWGQSNFANGITINEVADTHSPIYKNGVLTGYKMIKLAKPVTVYNLFGIGAYNSQAGFPNKTTILGTTYAYDHGWTSVPKAIDGAAAFLSSHYVHNTVLPQNTPYEIRYINSTKYMWHQYSSDIQYAATLGSIMSKYKYLYNSNDNFTFNIPVFNS
ncbi:MAG: SH3 domain-containing protein [Sarcina sp.]